VIQASGQRVFRIALCLDPETKPYYCRNLPPLQTVPTIIPMGYQALLFCPDEKSARLVAHVLSDLDFSVVPFT